MKFTKKRDYTGSICKAWSDDKKVCFGIAGTVGDLLHEGIFEHCDRPAEDWAFIPAPDINQKVCFAPDRKAVIENLIKQLERTKK